MTSKTLSQLPAASTLTGTELMLGVQGGEPVHITSDQITGYVAAAAATSESNAAAAATSATNASISESNALSYKDDAATSASSAATSESNAATSASSAATNAAAVQASYHSFNKAWLGNLSSDPTVDNNGDALLSGAEYFNTVEDKIRVYDGAVWGDYDATAQTATTAAALSASNAAASESNALSYKNEASSSATLSQNWATKIDGEVVTGQGYGAKKYANDAALSAQDAKIANFVGEIRPFAFGDTPTGWLDCDGAPHLISDYPLLFAKIGNIFGGDGVTDFCTPNLTNRIPVGAGGDFALAAMGGASTANITQDNLPDVPITVTVSDNGIAGTNDVMPSDLSPYLSSSGGSAGTATIWSDTLTSPYSGVQGFNLDGGGMPLSVMNPYLAVKFCIAATSDAAAEDVQTILDGIDGLNAMYASKASISDLVLSSLGAATAGNTIVNGMNQQTWEWSFDTTAVVDSAGLNITEDIASTKGGPIVARPALVKIGTLSGSTATALRVQIGGADAFVVRPTGISTNAPANSTDGGTAGAVNLTAGNDTSASGGTAGNVVLIGGASTVGTPGPVTIIGGSSASVAHAGADVILTGGLNSADRSMDGMVVLKTGTGVSGVGGEVEIQTSGGTSMMSFKADGTVAVAGAVTFTNLLDVTGGNLTAATQTAGTNDTHVATTEFVQTAVSAIGDVPSAGNGTLVNAGTVAAALLLDTSIGGYPFNPSTETVLLTAKYSGALDSATFGHIGWDWNGTQLSAVSTNSSDTRDVSWAIVKLA